MEPILLESPNYNIEETLKTVEQVVNSFRVVLKTGKIDGAYNFLQTAAQYRIAQEYEEFDDHGFQHGRHVEKSVKYAIRLIEKYRPGYFNSEFGRNVLYALMLFPHTHDWDQLNGAFNNAVSGTNIVNEKKGHALGSAVIVKALTPLLQQSCGFDEQQADEITSILAVMTARHDEPGNIDETFHQKNIYGANVADPELLLQLYLEDKINLSTLTDAQLVALLQAQKSRYGFINDVSQHGLSQHFERELAHEIRTLEQRNDPLLHIDELEKLNLLRIGVEIAYWADFVPMVAPVWGAITRTFASSYSRERSFFRSEHATDQNFIPPKGDIDTQVQTLLARIRDPKIGNELRTDAERLLWEYYHLGQLSHNSWLYVLPEMKKFMLEHKVMGLLALKKMAKMIMKGDYEIIDEIYDKRGELLEAQTQQKFEKLAETGKLESVYFDTLDEIEPIRSRFSDESERLKNILVQKRRTFLNGRRYSNKDIKLLVRLVNAVLDEIKKEYNLLDDDIIQYKSIVNDFGEAPSQLEMFTTDTIPLNPPDTVIEDVKNSP